MADDLTRVDALIDDLLAAHDPKSTDPTTFRGAQYDRGLAWVHFPEGFGGLILIGHLNDYPSPPAWLVSSDETTGLCGRDSGEGPEDTFPALACLQFSAVPDGTALQALCTQH